MRSAALAVFAPDWRCATQNSSTRASRRPHPPIGRARRLHCAYPASRSSGASPTTPRTAGARTTQCAWPPSTRLLRPPRPLTESERASAITDCSGWAPGTEYEAQSPARSSNRACESIPACYNIGANFVETPPDRTTGRACNAMPQLCAGSGYYQTRAGTTKSDRECGGLTACRASHFQTAATTSRGPRWRQVHARAVSRWHQRYSWLGLDIGHVFPPCGVLDRGPMLVRR